MHFYGSPGFLSPATFIQYCKKKVEASTGDLRNFGQKSKVEIVFKKISWSKIQTLVKNRNFSQVKVWTSVLKIGKFPIFAKNSLTKIVVHLYIYIYVIFDKCVFRYAVNTVKGPFWSDMKNGHL